MLRRLSDSFLFLLLELSRHLLFISLILKEEYVYGVVGGVFHDDGDEIDNHGVVDHDGIIDGDNVDDNDGCDFGDHGNDRDFKI